MKVLSVWVIVAATWILILTSYLLTGIDWSIVIFSTISLFCIVVVADWMIIDSAGKAKKKEPTVKTRDSKNS
jgi:membrane protein implicated in regulation of membrane protease activity